MRIVVVGAGIIGSCLAHELARAGERVVLADSGVPGGGASAASYAWLNSNSFDDPGYHALRVLGMSAYRELAVALGTSEWLHATGCVRVAVTDTDAKELRARVARKRAAGYLAELLSPDHAARTEPALARLRREPTAIASFPAEGYVDTTTLIGCLLEEFRVVGGVVARARVQSLLGDGAGVRTTEGDLVADRVVVCTGADTSLLRDAGFDLTARGPAGATVITAPVPVRMRGVIHFPDVTVRPDGGGRLLLHSVEIDERVDTATMTLGGAAVAELTGRAGKWLGLDAGDLDVAEVRVSVRPHPLDGFPVTGAVPGAPGAYVVCTHSGVTLAAVLARLVAAEIRTGEPDPLLAPYRPGRFLQPSHQDLELFLLIFRRIICWTSEEGGGHAGSMTGYEKAMRPEDLTRLFVERANAKDAAGIAALYEDGAVMAYPPGEQTTGREAIRDFWEKALPGTPRFEPEAPLPTLLSADGDIALTSTPPKDGAGARAQVVRRQPDGSWLRLLDHPELGRL